MLSKKVKSEEGHEECGILGFLWHFIFVQDLKILYFSLLRANKNVCKLMELTSTECSAGVGLVSAVAAALSFCTPHL